LKPRQNPRHVMAALDAAIHALPPKTRSPSAQQPRQPAA